MDRVNDIMRRMADHHTVEVDAEIASFQARVRQAAQQIDNFVHRHQRTRVDLDADSDPLTHQLGEAKIKTDSPNCHHAINGECALSSALARAKAGLSAVANRITTTIDGNPTPLGRAVAVARSAIASVSHNVTTTFNARRLSCAGFGSPFSFGFTAKQNYHGHKRKHGCTYALCGNGSRCSGVLTEKSMDQYRGSN